MARLLIAATLLEIAPLIQRRAPTYSAQTVGTAGTLLELPGVDVLVTGVGALPCAAHVSRTLATRQYV